MVALDHSCLENLRVVIAEEEEMICDYIKELLSEAGATVLAVTHTVRETLDLIEEVRPNAVTLDGKLKGIFAGEVAKRLDELGIRFLVVSGANYTLPDSRLETAPRLGKPFTPETFKAAVARHLC